MAKFRKKEFSQRSWKKLQTNEIIKKDIINWQHDSRFPVSLLWGAGFTIGEILRISELITDEIIGELR